MSHRFHVKRADDTLCVEPYENATLRASLEKLDEVLMEGPQVRLYEWI